MLRMGEAIRPAALGGKGREQGLGLVVTGRHEDPVCHRRDGESLLTIVRPWSQVVE
ncbi:hypothetical protein KCH_36160 [Kitasatospora cheerisanensis KCTC 2395]|uniref:Uncharacterized protein n=1 Tax=Kitasatospora cheerisanensis KCTC 2395 TaxID=1348663 RepID=A0A066YX13_9ACTN|nr:hypothetical protein KCH_36160 [Kitasatospora cheerisanensis KCTC 2395]